MVNLKKTVKDTINKLDAIIKLLETKYSPGSISSRMVSSVILPQLAYRLQVTPINKTMINSIDKKLKKLFKKNITSVFILQTIFY